MKIFVSYARRDRDAVDVLLQDMRRAHHEVWVDEELTGGQAWWDTILGAIRTTDLFVIALSPDLLKSRACAAEYEYAVACGRSILPVMVARVSPQMAPPAIANAQILDYVERTPNAAINLVTALAATPPSAALPDPLPSPPAVPMSYMNTYSERLGELSLNLQQQSLLFSELRVHLNDEDDRDTAIQLIRQLRARGDITESVGREIDALLASLPPVVSKESAWGAPADTVSVAAEPQRAQSVVGGAVPSPPPVTGEWKRDPYGRFELRYWDGQKWTDDVSTGGRQAKDPPIGAMAQAATGQPDPAFTPGVYVALIIASICFGLVGVIVGLINLKKPARNSQAKVLLIIGIISMVLGSAVYAGSGG